jgi:hypothetical protein
MQNRTFRWLTFCLWASLLIASTAVIANADMIQPNTALAAHTIKQLRHAAKIDDNRAQGHTAEDSDVGVYYHQKGQEARALADKLAGGQAIDSAEVEHALSTKGVVRYSPSY